MRTVVTGGAGFIGSTLTDALLAGGHDVEVIDDLSSGRLENLEVARQTGRLGFHEIDIRDNSVVDLLVELKPEVIFHLAAQADVRVSVARPGFDAGINILGSINILEGARHAGARRVVAAASGGTLYGDPPAEDIPTSETVAQSPLSPYGVSKKSMIDYLVAYQGLHGTEFMALALGNVYGPRQDPHGEAGVVAIFAEKLLRREAVTVFGTGEQTRDFVYVDDVVDAFVRAAERGQNQVVNIGTGEELSVNELLATMMAITDASAPPVHADARHGELFRSCLAVTRASTELGWSSTTSFHDGASATLEFVRGQLGDLS
ncbi:MAG: NAD-dependent epimerase/dehydratase family protein [Actinomycetes bacterium]